MRRRRPRALVATLLVVGLTLTGGAAGANKNTAPGQNPPTYTALPSISGTDAQGQTLSASSGSWSGPVQGYAYQWNRCDSSGAACSSIARATTQTYTLLATDVGSTIRVTVTASNKNGSSVATSSPSPAISAPSATTTSTTTSTTSSTTSTSTTTPTTTKSTTTTTTPTSTTTTTTPTSTTTTTPTSTTTTTTPTTTSPSPTGPCGGLAAQTPPTTVKHVVWVWMENHSYSEIIGSSSAPYINSLANTCGLATNYTAVTHPSLPNYIAATSGSTQGITDDNPPSSHPLSAPSIFGQVSSGSYEESMPSNCDLTDASPYAVKHNPEAYYTTIASACASHDVPLGGFNPSALPAFSFVTPNLCNDMHDCSVATGDAWLSSFIPTITSTSDYKAGNTVVFITWDEDDSSSANHVATLVLSPYTAPGTSSSTAFNHYSLLRTTEELLGLSSFLGNAASAPSMSAAFHLAGGSPSAPTPSTTTTTVPTTTTTTTTPLGYVPGIGLVAFGGTLHLDSNLDSYAYLISGGQGADASAQAAAPGTSLFYLDGFAVNSTMTGGYGVSYSDALANGWILNDCNGNAIHTYGRSNEYLADVGSSGYQQRFISNAEALLLANPGIDGAFIDNMLPDVTSETSGVVPCKYPSRSAWQSAVLSFVGTVGKALKSAGYYAAYNVTGYVNDSTYDNGTDAQNWFAALAQTGGASMLEDEYWMENPNNLSQLMSDQPNNCCYMTSWSGWQKLVSITQSYGVDFLAQMGGSGTDYQAMRYGRASFLLDWNGKGGAFAYGITPLYTGPDPWNPAWTANVGTPSAAKFTVAPYADVWERQFTGGVIVVNPTTSSANVTIAGTTYTIAATDALIIAS